MNNAISHRGPDATGTHHLQNLTGNYHFGANRLRILDRRAEADQPFVSEDQNHLLLFDGEIYNHQDLKNDLLHRGCRFQTASDTEVLLMGLKTEGPEFLQKLNGMFALVYHNQLLNETVVARDPAGMKALYYYSSEKYFLVSSEIKGILAAALFNKELNDNQVKQYLIYGYAQSPSTFFKQVEELEPGYVLNISTGKKKAIKLSNDDRPLPESGFEAKLVENTEEILIDAMLRHLQSEKPIGIFLSGGVDSTLLTALNQMYASKELYSFSIIFDEEKQNKQSDQYFANKAATEYGTWHQEILVTPDSLERLPQYVKQLDQPLGDGAAYLTYLLAAEAKKKVNSVITGAGADEFFAGYNRHQAFKFYLQNKHWLMKMKNSAGSLLKKSGGLIPLFAKEKFRLLERFTKSLDQNSYLTYLNFIRYHLYMDEKVEKISLVQEFRLDQALEYDRSNFLIKNVLRLNDKLSLAHGVESRSPYLDRELIQFVRKLPAQTIMKNGKKWILKQILDKYNGSSFSKRPKKGFGMPIGSWIENGYLDPLLHNLLNQNSPVYNYIHPTIIKEIVQQQKSRKAALGREIWALIILDRWLSNNF